MTLRAAGDDILVLSSNSETAEAENTASVIRALVSVVNKIVRLLHPLCIHCRNHGVLCVILNASADL